MPLVYQHNINVTAKLGVWHITEEESFFLNQVQPGKPISHPHKRLQHLAGRFLLQELYPGFPHIKIKAPVAVKPFLPDNPFHFSISHCGDYAAAIISTNEKVGVDVERIGEKAKKVYHKFLSMDEWHLLKASFQDDAFFSIAWSIKEAMYKWGGESAIDFKKHLIIQQIDVNGNEGIARCIFCKNEPIPVQVHFLTFNQNCISWLHTLQ